ncbi:hypothetical protein [Klebsiella phage vB_KpnP_23]|uniref:Uncharacterized protein n=1 Tax=Klebsiella phage SH-Kp 152410 TaxID=2066504 RepID=A0A2K9VGX1_9CAUD|nr:hypothetical protein HOS61_gp09 [Klebsiella phage SH-Kp 152410]AUV61474.1 hypothetical protein 2410_orf0008 [Klebsiella phage SH-Kp 152410]
MFLTAYTMGPDFAICIVDAGGYSSQVFNAIVARVSINMVYH